MRGSMWLLAVVTLTVVGCGTTRWEFNWDTFRFERVGPRASAWPSAEPSAQEPVERAEPPPEPSPPPRIRTAEPSPEKKKEAPIPTGRLYRLYLTREETVEGVSAESVYVVRQAPVAVLAELLALCFPGDGPGGSLRTRYIMYTDARARESARAFAGTLDQGGADTAWRTALDALYATPFPRRIDPQAHFRITHALGRLVNDEAADVDLRWGAGIILSHLCIRHEPRDFPTAGAALAQAGKVVPANSYRAMVVRYHQIKLLSARGLKLKATAEVRKALDQFATYQNTACYQMIRELAPKR